MVDWEGFVRRHCKFSILQHAWEELVHLWGISAFDKSYLNSSKTVLSVLYRVQMTQD
jgi:hypothetical protein